MDFNLDLSFLRPFQKEFFEKHKLNNVIVAHRRSGKTILAVTFLLYKALTKEGSYGYVAPFRSQAKQIAWDVLNNLARQIPGAIFNVSELKCTLPNGSTIMLFGADNQEALRGLDIRGVVLDEYKDISKTLFSEIISPQITAYKDGWVTYIGTPGGKNQFYDIYELAKTMPDDYYVDYKTVYDTGLLDDKQLERAKVNGTDENGDDAAFRQEYLLDWDVASKYAYYRKQVQELWKNPDRMVDNLFDQTQPVYTAWDIGVDDFTCIIFYQYIHGRVHLIDFYKNRGHGIEFYYETLKELPYKYDKHFLPHDAAAKEWGSGMTRQQTFEGFFGWDSTYILPRIPIADGIEAVRTLFPRMIFDTSLQDYINVVSEWGPKLNKEGLPTNTPIHCDVSDTIRYLATAFNEVVESEVDSEVIEIDYSELI